MKRARSIASGAVSFAFFASLVGCDSTEPAARRPNIILVTIDTLRADHLGVYGAARATSPNLDRLGADGIVYEQAIAQAPWTMPSMATLLTGLYPSQHGAIHVRAKLGGDHRTIAEVLQGAGYHTLGVVSHVFVNRERGFAQGFDVFDESMVLPESETTSPGITEVATSLLGRNLEEPFFLWVHYFDPHYSFVRHSEFSFANDYDGPLPERLDVAFLRALVKEPGRPRLLEDDLAYIRDVYDEEIAYTDAAIGVLLESVEQLGLSRPTMYIVTADHGEYFMERDRFGHDRDVYQALVRVPLIIAGDVKEDARGLRVAHPVETRSVAQTIFRMAGAPGRKFPGRDLVELASTPSAVPVAFSEGSNAWGAHDFKVAAFQGRWKLIHNRKPGTYEFYDLTSDPDEIEDLSQSELALHGKHRDLLTHRLARFRKRIRRPVAAPKIELDAERERHLRELGYIQ